MKLLEYNLLSLTIGVESAGSEVRSVDLVPSATHYLMLCIRFLIVKWEFQKYLHYKVIIRMKWLL